MHNKSSLYPQNNVLYVYTYTYVRTGEYVVRIYICSCYLLIVCSRLFMTLIS